MRIRFNDYRITLGDFGAESLTSVYHTNALRFILENSLGSVLENDRSVIPAQLCRFGVIVAKGTCILRMQGKVAQAKSLGNP